MEESNAKRGAELFTLMEAESVLPEIRRITREFYAPVEKLFTRLQGTPAFHRQAARGLEQRLDDLVRQWNGHVRRLGAIPRGLWTIDFDCGRGYYSWKYPEPGLKYWRAALGGPRVRAPILLKA